MAGVKTQHPQYAKYSGKWKRCRDVSCGQDEVQNAGVAYLPKLKDQLQEDYDAYVKRALFYNATWRTISGLVGMMFRKPPKLTMPKGIEQFLNDVNGKGMKFERFAQLTATDVIEVGRFGVLVDYPAPPKDNIPVTVARAEELGLRPLMQMYKTETIINWKTRRIGNKTVLSLVVLQEDMPDTSDKYEQKVKTVYRVLELDASNAYRVSVIEIKDEKEIILEEFVPLMNGAPLPYIPFIFFNPYGTDPDADDPPLIDLVNVNLSHYRTSADYENGCHFTGLPTAVISGYEVGKDAKGVATEKFYIGSSTAWVFPNPQASANYLEFTGQGLNALKDNMASKEQQMAVLGARMLAEEKKQVETFGVTALKFNGENSILANIADTLSQGLERALYIFTLWSGAEVKQEDIKVEVNKQFLPVSMDAPTLLALMQTWQAGGLSDKEFFDTLQRGDVIEDSAKTFEEHQAEVENNMIPPPDPNAKPAPNGQDNQA